MKPFNRFYGIGSGDIHIGGMSGGPLIGLKRVDGRMKYWTIGVQSGWRESSRVIAACPLDFFARQVSEAIDQAFPGSLMVESRGYC